MNIAQNESWPNSPEDVATVSSQCSSSTNSVDDNFPYELLAIAEWPDSIDTAAATVNNNNNNRSIDGAADRVDSVDHAGDVPLSLCLSGDGERLAVLLSRQLQYRQSCDVFASVCCSVSLAATAACCQCQMCWGHDWLALACFNNNTSSSCSSLLTVYSQQQLQPVFSEQLLATSATECDKCSLVELEVDNDGRLMLLFSDARLLIYCVSTGDVSGHSCQRVFSGRLSLDGRVPLSSLYCCQLVPATNLLLASACDHRLYGNRQLAGLASCEGLLAWRVICEDPHLKPCLSSVEESALSRNGNTVSAAVDGIVYDRLGDRYKSLSSWLRRWRDSSDTSLSMSSLVDCIVGMSISPDCTRLLTRHKSGALSLWHLPTLRQLSQWPLSAQPGYGAVSPALLQLTTEQRSRLLHQSASETGAGVDEADQGLLSAHWWSDTAAVLSRGSGSITVCHLRGSHVDHQLVNMLGDSGGEFFSRRPSVVVSAEAQLMLVLERHFVCSACVNGGDINVADDHGNNDRASDSEDSSFNSSCWQCHLAMYNMKNVNDDTSGFRWPSILTTLNHKARATLHWLTDWEQFEPLSPSLSSLPPGTGNQQRWWHYRLSCLRRTTPEQLLLRRLEHQEYSEALALAVRFSLDTDAVYIDQWYSAVRGSGVTQRSVDAFLGRLNNTQLAVTECCHRLATTAHDSAYILDFGLQLTDGSQLSTSNYSTAQLQQLAASRRQLLHYRRCLYLYRHISGGGSEFDAGQYGRMRSLSSLQLARQLARAGDWRRLLRLLQLVSEVRGHWLQLLDQLPVTLPPLVYAPLLHVRHEWQKALDTHSHTELQLTADWSDSYVESSSNSSILSTATTDLSYTPLVAPPSDDEMNQWAMARCQHIVANSSLIEHGVQLLQILCDRQQSPAPRLHQRLHQLRTMSVLVHQLSHAGLQWSQFEELSVSRVFDMLAGDITVDNADDVLVGRAEQCGQGRLKSYLDALPTNLAYSVFADWLQQKAVGNIELVECVLRHICNMTSLLDGGSDVTVSISYSPFATDAVALYRLIIACASVNRESSDAAIIALNQLCCLRPQGSADDQCSAGLWEVRKLVQLCERVMALDVLKQHGVAYCMADFTALHSSNDAEKAWHSPLSSQMSSSNQTYKQICLSTVATEGNESSTVSNGSDCAASCRRLLTRLAHAALYRHRLPWQQSWKAVEAVWRTGVSNTSAASRPPVVSEQQCRPPVVSEQQCRQLFLSVLLTGGDYEYIELAVQLMRPDQLSDHASAGNNRQLSVCLASWQQCGELLTTAAEQYFDSAADIDDSRQLQLCQHVLQLGEQLQLESPVAGSSAYWSGLSRQRRLLDSVALIADLGVNITPPQLRLCSDYTGLLLQQCVAVLARSPRRLLQHRHKLHQLCQLWGVEDSWRLQLVVGECGLLEGEVSLCVSVCRQLASQGVGQVWPLCCRLASDSRATLVSRLEMINTALVHCPSHQLQSLLQTKQQLLLQQQQQQQSGEETTWDVESLDRDGPQSLGDDSDGRGDSGRARVIHSAKSLVNLTTSSVARITSQTTASLRPLAKGSRPHTNETSQPQRSSSKTVEVSDEDSQPFVSDMSQCRMLPEFYSQSVSDLSPSAKNTTLNTPSQLHCLSRLLSQPNSEFSVAVARLQHTVTQLTQTTVHDKQQQQQQLTALSSAVGSLLTAAAAGVDWQLAAVCSICLLHTAAFTSSLPSSHSLVGCFTAAYLTAFRVTHPDQRFSRHLVVNAVTSSSTNNDSGAVINVLKERLSCAERHWLLREQQPRSPGSAYSQRVTPRGFQRYKQRRRRAIIKSVASCLKAHSLQRAARMARVFGVKIGQRRLALSQLSSRLTPDSSASRDMDDPAGLQSLLQSDPLLSRALSDSQLLRQMLFREVEPVLLDSCHEISVSHHYLQNYLQLVSTSFSQQQTERTVLEQQLKLLQLLAVDDSSECGGSITDRFWQLLAGDELVLMSVVDRNNVDQLMQIATDFRHANISTLSLSTSLAKCINFTPCLVVSAWIRRSWQQQQQQLLQPSSSSSGQSVDQLMEQLKQLLLQLDCESELVGSAECVLFSQEAVDCCLQWRQEALDVIVQCVEQHKPSVDTNTDTQLWLSQCRESVAVWREHLEYLEWDGYRELLSSEDGTVRELARQFDLTGGDTERLRQLPVEAAKHGCSGLALQQLLAVLPLHVTVKAVDVLSTALHQCIGEVDNDCDSIELSSVGLCIVGCLQERVVEPADITSAWTKACCQISNSRQVGLALQLLSTAAETLSLSPGVCELRRCLPILLWNDTRRTLGITLGLDITPDHLTDDSSRLQLLQQLVAGACSWADICQLRDLVWQVWPSFDLPIYRDPATNPLLQLCRRCRLLQLPDQLLQLTADHCNTDRLPAAVHWQLLQLLTDDETAAVHDDAEIRDCWLKTAVRLALSSTDQGVRSMAVEICQRVLPSQSSPPAAAAVSWPLQPEWLQQLLQAQLLPVMVGGPLYDPAVQLLLTQSSHQQLLSAVELLKRAGYQLEAARLLMEARANPRHQQPAALTAAKQAATRVLSKFL